MEAGLMMTRVKANELKSLALAYMGDAVYEKYVREHLIEQGKVKVQELHSLAITYVKADAQANVLKEWLAQEKLTTEETQIAKRGRNAKSGSTPKSTTVQTYRYSTAFEALIGFLYLDGQIDRLEELIQLAIEKVEEGVEME